MKNTKELLFQSLIMLILSIFTFTVAHAQEEKEEKKVIKMKVLAEDDGNLRIDTMIVLDENFDGDWEKITDDEEILEKLKKIDLDIDIDEESEVYIIRAPHTQKKAYYYSSDTDEEGNVFVEIELGQEETQNVWVSQADGDSTITIVMKSADCKHKSHEEKHKVVVSKTMNVEVETVNGDTLITYTIHTGDDHGEENVMIWTSDDEEISYEILMEQIDSDSSKIIIMTTGDDGEELKIIKKKEFIIITEDEHDCDHDHNKDKDKGKDKDKDKKNKK